MLVFTVIQPSEAGWATLRTLPWHSVLALRAVPEYHIGTACSSSVSPSRPGIPKVFMCSSSKHLNIPTYVYICFFTNYIRILSFIKIKRMIYMCVYSPTYLFVYLIFFLPYSGSFLFPRPPACRSHCEDHCSRPCVLHPSFIHSPPPISSTTYSVQGPY